MRAMNQAAATSDPAAENRRAQLRKWIDHFFAGSQAAFGASTANTEKGERQINQGELSSLLKSKSFGEKRARSLERQAQMPAGYLDSTSSPGATQLTPFLQVNAPANTTESAFRPAIAWPFKIVSYQRLLAAKAALGPRAGAEAIHDIDKQLDIVLTKWERDAQQPKKRASGS